MKVGDKVYRVRVSYGSACFGEATVSKVSPKRVTIQKPIDGAPFGWRKQFSSDEVHPTPADAWRAALAEIREAKKQAEDVLHKWQSLEGQVEAAIADAEHKS